MSDKHLMRIPDDVRDTVIAEIKARDFSVIQIRWLTALMLENPLSPAPTAAAIVARVSQQPLGETLLGIETLLNQLPDPQTNILPAEKRMTAVILKDLNKRLSEILTQLTGA